MHIPRKPGFLRAVTENVKYAVVCASRPTKVGNDTPILEDALPGIIHLGGDPKAIYWSEPTGAHAQRTHCGMAFLHRFVCKPFTFPLMSRCRVQALTPRYIPMLQQIWAKNWRTMCTKRLQLSSPPLQISVYRIFHSPRAVDIGATANRTS